jgi:hypothetical protein
MDKPLFSDLESEVAEVLRQFGGVKTLTLASNYYGYVNTDDRLVFMGFQELYDTPDYQPAERDQYHPTAKNKFRDSFPQECSFRQFSTQKLQRLWDEDLADDLRWAMPRMDFKVITTSHHKLDYETERKLYDEKRNAIRKEVIVSAAGMRSIGLKVPLRESLADVFWVICKMKSIHPKKIVEHRYSLHINDVGMKTPATEDSTIYSLCLPDVHEPEIFIKFFDRHPWSLADLHCEKNSRRYKEWLKSEEGQLALRAEGLKADDELARLLLEEEEMVLEGMDWNGDEDFQQVPNERLPSLANMGVQPLPTEHLSFPFETPEPKAQNYF